MMPYETFKNLSDEDLASVVVYLRSMAPVHNPLPPHASQFSGELSGSQRAATALLQPVPGPDASNPLARGKYFATLGCGCHHAVESLPYGGGEHLRVRGAM